MTSISQKFVNGVGFSNGCALFTLYQPPPLVKSCLMDSKDATGPTGMLWVSTFASTMTGMLVMIGTPLASTCGTSTITATPLVISGFPSAPSFGDETTNWILVVTLLPLSSVFCTCVV